MPEQTNGAASAVVDPDFHGVLSRVGAEVLETMFFAEAVSTGCDHSWLSSSCSAQLGFEGSHSGDFRLSVSPPAAESIASAFLGLDPEEVTETQRSQVLLELANILCGSVLSHFWPESDLSLLEPECFSAEAPLEGEVHQCFLMPEGMLAVSIHLSGAVRNASS
jgi:hypothetical protein